MISDSDHFEDLRRKVGLSHMCVIFHNNTLDIKDTKKYKEITVS